METGKFKREADRLPKKRGRKPKADKISYRLSVRFTDKEHRRFLSMFEHSGMKSKSKFITMHVLEKKMDVVVINKSLIDYTQSLSDLFFQFRKVGNNYDQTIRMLYANLERDEARKMEQAIRPSMMKLVTVMVGLEYLYNELRTSCLPR
jgi:hypothetical protein